jgi:hypothetical protein
LRTYLQPSATRYLTGLSETERASHLSANPFIMFWDNTATFDWPAYLAHVGACKKTRRRSTHSNCRRATTLFGHGATKARHFTEFSAQRTTTGSKQLDEMTSHNCSTCESQRQRNQALSTAQPNVNSCVRGPNSFECPLDVSSDMTMRIVRWAN